MWSTNLKGKNAEYNAQKIIDIYKGASNEFSQSVALNVAAGLIVSGKENNFKDDDLFIIQDKKQISYGFTIKYNVKDYSSMASYLNESGNN